MNVPYSRADSPPMHSVQKTLIPDPRVSSTALRPVIEFGGV